VNLSDILGFYDQDERINSEWPPMRRDVSPALVRHLPPDGSARDNGFVAYTRLDAATADRVIEDQIDFFSGRGLGIGWKVYGHDTPEDLGERLIARGFTPDDPESIMVLELDSIPAELTSSARLDIRRIRDPLDLPQVRGITRAVWNDEMADLFDDLAYRLSHDPEHLSIYVAWCDGKPVSAAWLRLPAAGRFASLWGGSTLEEYRGRGFYTALLATRVREAAERGLRFVTVDAGPMSKPIAERFGFREMTTARDYNLARP